mmetsp:Transcript_12317/g.28695  ORF Transcript_12317/g.28695 Transcript_12317/m.28695 type:complete len:256 (-) Transcript_12317:222-989(-)
MILTSPWITLGGTSLRSLEASSASLAAPGLVSTFCGGDGVCCPPPPETRCWGGVAVALGGDCCCSPAGPPFGGPSCGVAAEPLNMSRLDLTLPMLLVSCSGSGVMPSHPPVAEGGAGVETSEVSSSSSCKPSISCNPDIPPICACSIARPDPGLLGRWPFVAKGWLFSFAIARPSKDFALWLTDSLAMLLSSTPPGLPPVPAGGGASGRGWLVGVPVLSLKLAALLCISIALISASPTARSDAASCGGGAGPPAS